MKAQNVLYSIIESQIMTVTPYMLYKDACNRTWGPSSAPTSGSEIVEYSAPDEVAVCNLASITVNMFVKPVCLV